VTFKGPFKNKNAVRSCLNNYNAIWERVEEDDGPRFRLLKNGKVISKTN
jgi:hypothetical protein